MRRENSLSPQRPSPRASSRPGPGLAWWALGLVLFAAALVVGLVLSLPVSVLEQRLTHEIARQTPYRLQIGESRLTLPLGLQANDLVVSGGQVPLLPLTVDRLQLDPAWLALLTFDPALEWDVRLLNGTLAGELYADGRWQAEGAGLVLDFPLRPPSDLAVSMRLVELAGQGSLNLAPETPSELVAGFEQIVLRGLGLTSANTPGLFLGQGSLKITGRGRSFEVEELRITGGDLEVHGQGQLLLANEPARSRINLALELRPAATAPPELNDLLELVTRRQPDGSYRLSLNGPLTNPVLRP